MSKLQQDKENTVPVYEFRCDDTGKRFEVSFKTVGDYATAHITSPYTGSEHVTRLIRRVAVMQGKPNLQGLIDGDERTIQTMEEADPATMGRILRGMADESGQTFGNEFHDVVDRLESGQSPDQIESSITQPES